MSAAEGTMTHERDADRRRASGGAAWRSRAPWRGLTTGAPTTHLVAGRSGPRHDRAEARAALRRFAVTCSNRAPGVHAPGSGANVAAAERPWSRTERLDGRAALRRFAVVRSKPCARGHRPRARGPARDHCPRGRRSRTERLDGRAALRRCAAVCSKPCARGSRPGHMDPHVVAAREGSDHGRNDWTVVQRSGAARPSARSHALEAHAPCAWTRTWSLPERAAITDGTTGRTRGAPELRGRLLEAMRSRPTSSGTWTRT